MRKGFTLSELLIALIVAGVVTALTMPVMITKVNNKAFVTQLKNVVGIIEQVAEDELVTHKTSDLSDTDFADPDKLLSETHFHIAGKCSGGSNSLTNCWKTSGSNAITYKTIDGSNAKIDGLGAKAVILKNGVTMNFSIGNESEQAYRGGTIAGYMYVDVNGSNKPNIFGRDAFLLWITKKGEVVGYAYVKEETKSASELLSACKSGSGYGFYYCTDVLLNNGWKMDY